MNDWKPRYITNETRITCPKCGHFDKYFDPEMEDEQDSEFECELCYSKLKVTCSISVRYFTRIIDVEAEE